MSERKKETDFLKSIIQWDESGQCQELQDRIKQAERDERCIRVAVCLVGLLGMLSLSGLGYAAVFVPEFAHFSSHIATKIFLALGLASMICLASFLGFWLRCRAASNQVYDEVRRFVREVLQARLKQETLQSATVSVTNGTAAVYRIETEGSREEDTDFLELSQAS